MGITKKIISIIGMGFLLITTNLSAVDKTAKSVMMNAYNYIDGLEKYAFDAVVVDKSVDNSKVIGEYKHNIAVEVSRPNKLRVNIKGEFKDSSNYLNNGKFIMLDNKTGYYGEIETPKDINKALDYILYKYGIKAPLATLIYTGMGKKAKFTRSKYFGIENISGVPCDYIAFRNGNREIHIWVATGDKPIIKYYTEINKSYKINTTVFWQDTLRISDKDFVFKASKGVSKISVESAK